MIKSFRAPSLSLKRYLQTLRERNSPQNKKINTVRDIIKQVREGGDKSLIRLTEKYNGVVLTKKTLLVSKREIDTSIRGIPLRDKELILRIMKRIIEYHRKIKIHSSIFKEKGISLGELWQPMDIVGIYVPSGYRPLVSSLLMTACPARAAGVREIILATPPSNKGEVNPYILYTATLLGIKRIYKVGGAQAIAALSFGTETIPRVQKIAGPGNIYVTLAKKLLCGEVGIDLLAGPSEIVILADNTSNPEYIGWDFLSQAEHGDDACSILITTSGLLLEKVKQSLKRDILRLGRDTPVRNALRNYSALILVNSLRDGIKLINEIAPEHLEIVIKDFRKVLPSIKNAGSIFIGPYSPVPMGDYIAGPSHVLPTSSTSRFSQGITTQTFMKRTSFIYSKENGFLRLNRDAIRMAEIEGLKAHRISISIRHAKAKRRV